MLALMAPGYAIHGNFSGVVVYEKGLAMSRHDEKREQSVEWSRRLNRHARDAEMHTYCTVSSL
jgi:hypothetical protein